MFPIVVNDGANPFPNDDIYYIVCKEGVYLKKKLGVMESIAPVKSISILKSIETMAKMHIKKIPATKAKQVINFFKAVYKEHHAEAIVLLFYNQELKKHKIICPFQKVSAGGADYNKGLVLEGYDMIGTIHSHAAMSAFHSGIDDKDEESFDGLHITFGNMRDDDISVSASIVANGFRVIVDPRDYINKIEMTVDVDEEEKIPYAKTWKWDHTQKKMMQVETSGKFYTRKKFDQRFQISLSKDPKFDPKWMEYVEKQVYTYKTSKAGKNWYDGWYGHDAQSYGVGSYWNGWNGHQNTPAKKTSGYTAPGVVKPKNNLTTTGKVEGVTNPCDACTFKHHKLIPVLDDLNDEAKKEIIGWALDQLDKNANFKISESLDDECDMVHYECISCNSKFTVDESAEALGEACCPICKVDDYLMEITATEMLMEESVSDEEIEESGLGMIECKNCHSSFTKDFLRNGECPSCGTILVAEEHSSNEQTSDVDYEDNEFIQCPKCKRHFARVSLHFDNHCKFCLYEFDASEIASTNITSEEIAEEISKIDSGAYLNPEREAIENSIVADEDVERIPVPGTDSVPLNKPTKKRGILSNLFQRRNRKT